jgi:hypothetical protein
VSENRRTAARHPVDVPVTVKDAETREVRIVNLSVGGALIAHARMPMGHRLHLRFTVPTVDHTIEIGAIVRWSTDREIGVQFDGLRPKDVWALNQFFASL